MNAQSEGQYLQGVLVKLTCLGLKTYSAVNYGENLLLRFSPAFTEDLRYARGTWKMQQVEHLHNTPV